MVAHRYADAAETAVFGARGFGEVAGGAGGGWVEERVVVGVVPDPDVVGGGSDVVRGVRGAEVGEDVG